MRTYKIYIRLEITPGDGIADMIALEAIVRKDVRVQVPPWRLKLGYRRN